MSIIKKLTANYERKEEFVTVVSPGDALLMTIITPEMFVVT